MAPNLREYLSRDLTPNSNASINFPSPESDSVSLSDVELWTNSEDTESEENISLDWNISLQNDLRDLLLKVTATEDLATVTQLKLKVITREISLQQLSIYTPALRELILDGSYVSSLRDLGCGLKNLKILRLNRCSLYHFDSMSGVENLEEIYATDNYLVDISSCAFLPRIKIIDVRRNNIISMRTIRFLYLCTELRHLRLEGNDVTLKQHFSREVKEALPTLSLLDGRSLEVEVIEEDIEAVHNPEALEKVTNSTLGRMEEIKKGLPSFTVQFPPRVLTDNPGSSKM